MRISGTEPSSVVLRQRSNFKNWYLYNIWWFQLKTEHSLINVDWTILISLWIFEIKVSTWCQEWELTLSYIKNFDLILSIFNKILHTYTTNMQVFLIAQFIWNITQCQFKSIWCRKCIFIHWFMTFFKMTSLQQLHLSRSDSHYEIINNNLTHFFTSQR